MRHPYALVICVMGVRLDPGTAQNETSVVIVQQFYCPKQCCNNPQPEHRNSPISLAEGSPGRESRQTGDRQGASKQG